jgi:hypothetical protein
MRVSLSEYCQDFPLSRDGGFPLRDKGFLRDGHVIVKYQTKKGAISALV